MRESEARRIKHVLLVAVIGSLAMAGCEALIDVGALRDRADADARSSDARGEPEATVDASTDAGVDAPAEVSPALACLAGRSLPPVQKTTATVDWYLHDMINPSQPVTAVNVSLCPSSPGFQCAGVLGTKVPDSTGHVVFTLDLSQGPFTGYLLINPITPDAGAPSDASASIPYLPALATYSAAPIFGDLQDAFELGTAPELLALANLYHLPQPDPGEGTSFVTMNDCNYDVIAGISGSIDTPLPKGLSFYFDNGIPTLAATSTDSTGIEGFYNVPSGVHTYTATVVATGQPFGSLTMYTLPGTISYAELAPPYTD
jgi:hypothetical protein